MSDFLILVNVFIRGIYSIVLCMLKNEIDIHSSITRSESLQLKLSSWIMRWVIINALIIADWIWSPLWDKLLLDLRLVIFKLLDAQVLRMYLIDEHVLGHESLQLLRLSGFLFDLRLSDDIVTSRDIHVQHYDLLIQWVNHWLHLFFLFVIDSLIMF